MKRPYLALVALLGFSVYTAYTLWLADQPLIEFGLALMSSPSIGPLLYIVVNGFKNRGQP